MTTDTRLAREHPTSLTTKQSSSSDGPLAKNSRRFAVAEFFAGIGLMAEGLERSGFDVVWANDIERAKHDLYVSNRKNGIDVFQLGDVRDVSGSTLPKTVDLATASFPCIDLSLAGKRVGLAGAQSGMFWEFARVLDEMGETNRPRLVLLENVHGFATSHGGQDLRAALQEMNRLGYSCDVFAINARHFVPQSRPRMFVVGVRGNLPGAINRGIPQVSDIRPAWVRGIYAANSDLQLHYRPMSELPIGPSDLESIVEPILPSDERWWSDEKTVAFETSLSPLQLGRLGAMKVSATTVHRTAYRRTRNGSATWEIRADTIAGCLRTTGGGSSRQALVEAGGGTFRVRWMTPREYARLMGVGDFLTSAGSENQALFGFGDAVVVDVIRWIADEYLHSALVESER